MNRTAGHIEAAVLARAQQGARRAGLMIVGIILFLVAVGFFSAALWIVIEQYHSDIAAALSLGGLYLVAGLILLLMARKPRPRRTAHMDHPAATAPRRPSPYPQIAEAFVFGMDTAMRLRRSRERR